MSAADVDARRADGKQAQRVAAKEIGPKGPVLHLMPVSVCRDTVETLEGLLQQARIGSVTGIAFAATFRRASYLTLATGECLNRPTLTRGMLATLIDELSDIVREEDIDWRAK